MFIPPSHLKDNFGAGKETKSMVRLKSSHLLIDHEIAVEVFGDDFNVHLVYYADRKSLLIAPKSDDLFKQLHKANQLMLKDRNLKGDKSIAIHEILIDNQVDDSDRDLSYELEAGLGILNIRL